jgi:aspartate/methionine/tyrosine aminotransferase
MALTEPSGARVDLELNYPVLAEQPGLVAESLARLLDNDSLFAVLQPIGVVGTPAAREAAASLLRRRDWAPDPDRILFAGNGRQAIAATIAALVPVGERLGVEALTYPVVKAIAGRVGVTLVPLAIDENGLIPDAVRTAHRAGPLRAVYLQPTLHNPLGVAMPDRRRAELADILHDRGIYAIEDAVYGFLHDEPPLASLAPDHTVLVESLSKRLAPGLSVGFAVARGLGGPAFRHRRLHSVDFRRYRRRHNASQAARRHGSPGDRAQTARGIRHSIRCTRLPLLVGAAGTVAGRDVRGCSRSTRHRCHPCCCLCGWAWARSKCGTPGPWLPAA